MLWMLFRRRNNVVRVQGCDYVNYQRLFASFLVVKSFIPVFEEGVFVDNSVPYLFTETSPR